MIERDFIAQKTKEHYIKKYVEEKLPRVGISSIKLKKIPLGEKIIIKTSRPSLVVGSKGSNIKDLTKALKKKFHLENPQVEIIEVKDIFLDAQIVAEKIATSLERFGAARFKSIGHKIMENVLNSGALGVELVISGKIPGARAKSWRFYQGYLKKCGDIAVEGVRKAQAAALLKSGVIGIKVAIMPPDLVLPDKVEILAEPQQVVVVVAEEEKEKKKAPRKRSPKKKSEKKGAKEKATDAATGADAQLSEGSEGAAGLPGKAKEEKSEEEEGSDEGKAGSAGDAAEGEDIAEEEAASGDAGDGTDDDADEDTGVEPEEEKS